jgi:hypothetical protein
MDPEEPAELEKGEDLKLLVQENSFSIYYSCVMCGN